ncbi:hypothetical protein DYB32_004386 [Aphanomyces invadans]|uniref:Uncharacterized protein n=1 Tax=Aphanomyces invadans TaxID=157072 RepID=A0A3R6YZN4_9STRA|nr:hypothetical protein DYB32_004386 [Aphanomyces invadans]
MHAGGNPGLQRSYSGASLSATPTQSSAASAGTNNGHATSGPSSSGPVDTVPYPDPTMRRTTMQALYMRYKQLHGNKIDDTTLQRMAARTEHQIATTSTNREEYTINAQNEMSRIDISQRMYTPPHSDGTTNATKPGGMAPSLTPTAANSFAHQQQQHMLQRQLSQNSAGFGDNSNMQQVLQQQMLANAGGNPFQHAAAPGNLSYQEFSQRMHFQPMDKLVEIMWNQRLMIFQLQQENAALKKQCASFQQIVMSMNMSSMQHNGYNGAPGLMQPQHAASFFGQPTVPSQPPMKGASVFGPTTPTGGYSMASHAPQPHMDPKGQLSRQTSMTNGATAFGTPQQPQQVSTPQPGYGASTPGAAQPTGATPSMGAANTGAAPVAMTPAMSAAYWAKVQELRTKYYDQLKQAYHILCMAAQSGSRQTSKAESMKQNIHYAMVVINEAEGAPPRDPNVLQAIETFIVDSIVPLVRKVHEVSQQQQHLQKQATAGPGEFTKQLTDAMAHQQQHQHQQPSPSSHAAPTPLQQDQAPPAKPTQPSQPPQVQAEVSPVVAPAPSAPVAAAPAVVRQPPPSADSSTKENQAQLTNMDVFDDFQGLDDLDKLEDDDDDESSAMDVDTALPKAPEAAGVQLAAPTPATTTGAGAPVEVTTGESSTSDSAPSVAENPVSDAPSTASTSSSTSSSPPPPTSPKDDSASSKRPHSAI